MRFAFLKALVFIALLVAQQPRALATCDEDGLYKGQRLTDVLDVLFDESLKDEFAEKLAKGPSEGPRPEKRLTEVLDDLSDESPPKYDNTPAIIILRPVKDIHRPPPVTQKSERAFAPEGLKFPGGEKEPAPLTITFRTPRPPTAREEMPPIPKPDLSAKARGFAKREKMPALEKPTARKPRLDTTQSEIKKAVKRAVDETDELQLLIAAAQADKAKKISAEAEKARRVTINGKPVVAPASLPEGNVYFVKTQYPNTYDPKKPLEDQFTAVVMVPDGPGNVRTTKQIRAAPQPVLEPGHPKDAYFVGDSSSSVSKAPADYKVLGKDAPLPPPPPFPTETIEFLDATIEERLAAILKPGEHATRIGGGGTSEAFAIHPPMPAEVQALAEEARVGWALENGTEVIKIRKSSENPDPVHRDLENQEIVVSLRQEWARMHQADEIYRNRVSIGDRRFVYVVTHDGSLLHAAASRHKIVRGPPAWKVKNWLDEIDNPATTAAKRIELIGNLKKHKIRLYSNGEPMLDRIKGEIGALEQSKRDFHVNGTNWQREDDKIMRARVRGTKGRDGNPYEEFLDGLNGDNDVWDPEAQMWAEIDF